MHSYNALRSGGVSLGDSSGPSLGGESDTVTQALAVWGRSAVSCCDPKSLPRLLVRYGRSKWNTECGPTRAGTRRLLYTLQLDAGFISRCCFLFISLMSLLRFPPPLPLFVESCNVMSCTITVQVQILARLYSVLASWSSFHREEVIP